MDAGVADHVWWLEKIAGLAVVATQRKERPDESDREKILPARDFAARERFYPADHIVTNPYNRLVDKAFVMERIRADVISYASFERQFDLFRVYGDTAVVVGSEKVVPATDAKRPDAGQTIRRRFTEVWVRRDGTCQVVARHASNIAPSN